MKIKVSLKNCKGIIADSWKSLEQLKIEKNIPVLCLAHGTELPLRSNKIKALRIKRAYNKANRIIANSKYTCRLAELYVEDQSRIKIIHPGINKPEEHDLKITAQIEQRFSGRSPMLLSLARLEKRKGVDTIINLLPRLKIKYPEIIYLVLGRGAEKNNLEKLVKKNKLEKLVTFVDRVTEAEKNAYLKASDLFVMPGKPAGNDIEGFGIAYIEAAWHGVPAISGNTGGVVEAVIDGETGINCDGNDEEAVYEATCDLLDNHDLRKKLGAKAKERAQELLWSNLIIEYEALLDLT